MASVLQQRMLIPPPGTTDDSLRGPRGPPQHWCPPCVLASRSIIQQTPGTLFRCSACKLFRYCSREHQAQDREQHREICKNMKKGRTQLAKEEAGVRHATPDLMTPANAFETDVGRFWGLDSTRPYMEARFMVAEACRKTATLDGITEGLEHMQDMLRLCASDNIGAYDFVKWWQTEGIDDGGYDDETSTIKRPVRNANPLQSVKFMQHKYVDVQHLAAMLLLKFKLLVDIIHLKLSRKVLQERLPTELWSQVDQYVVRSDISLRWAGKTYGALTAAQKHLERQITILIKTTQEITEYFPWALLNPDEYLSMQPEYVSRGSKEETALFINQTYAAWWEHEGVLELFCGALMLAGMCTDNMHHMPANYGTVCRVSRHLLVRQEITENTCDFLADAAEDAFNLSGSRPSDHRRQQQNRRELFDLHAMRHSLLD